MTTIAYRDGVLAADTMYCRGDSSIVGVVKIAIGADGRKGGACGSATFLSAWLAWINGEASRPEAAKDADSCDAGLIIWPGGRIEIFEPGGSFSVTSEYFAMGSGRPEALGAMHAGADPEAAVKAAIAHDCHTGGEVTVIRHTI